MTCVIGLVHQEKIYIGADSAGVDSDLSLVARDDPKVFRNGDFVIGFTSSFRMGQILRFKFKPPQRYEGTIDYEYMVTEFVDEVRNCLKDGGFARVKENQESGGTFMVGYRKSLYTIFDDFQVGINRCGFAACGCGQMLALGAMAANAHLTDPEARILNALEIAEMFNAGVRRPFHIEKL